MGISRHRVSVCVCVSVTRWYCIKTAKRRITQTTPHVTELLKQCSQCVYLLRLLRSQALSAEHLSTVFVGFIISRLMYALPACSMFVSAGQAGRIDAFLKRAYKWGLSKDRVTLNELVHKFGLSLFQKIQSPMHCLNLLLPPKKIHS